ncbi:MAG: hypothetical protein BMS9Abin09_0940 [Gammaproteobacteria bacterium]|nr:MAG: hypothetical protein BMS9Abin09_0940 [Gammaproteobacteria bacterium]
MRPQITKPTRSSPRQQRGAALLILLTLVVLAAGYTLLKRLNQTPSDLSRAGDTAVVLGEAKAALMGFALSSQVRPGVLPCPDNTANGGDGNSALTCTGAGNVTFRLPWKTLGLPDLRDSSGERLWYAVDPLFSGAAGINSDTLATQTIDGGATRYVAVIIAPGKSLPGQSRSGSQQNNILRYLEGDNANNDTVFVTAAAGNFNDQIIGITRDELMQVVERRVLKEVSDSLNTYFSENNYFPNPAPAGLSICDSTIFAGMVPTTINNVNCISQTEWDVPPTAADLPAWFQPNNWNQVIWYVVSTDCVEGASNCIVTNLVTINDPPNTSNVQAVLIAGGAALAGLSQNNRSPITSDNDLLDSGENRDDDAVFEILPIDTTSNDQIQVVAP